MIGLWRDLYKAGKNGLMRLFKKPRTGTTLPLRSIYDDMAKPQLIQALVEMNQEIKQLEAVKDDTKWLEDTLKKRTRVLNERIKELSCLFESVKLFRRIDLSFEEKVQGVVELLPGACQNQGRAFARVIINQKEYKSANYRKSEMKISNGIRVRDKFVGLVEVGYLNDSALDPRQIFLDEEKSLVEIVSEFLGMAIENTPAFPSNS